MKMCIFLNVIPRRVINYPIKHIIYMQVKAWSLNEEDKLTVRNIPRLILKHALGGCGSVMYSHYILSKKIKIFKTILVLLRLRKVGRFKDHRQHMGINEVQPFGMQTGIHQSVSQIRLVSTFTCTCKLQCQGVSKQAFLVH